MDRTRVPFRQFLSATAIVIVLVWSTAFPAWADDLGASKSDLIRSLLPTVVNISVSKDEPATPSTTEATGAATPKPDTSLTIKSYVGSGFVIDPSGLIVTNYHVVEYAYEITVGFSDGSRLPGKLLSASRLVDLAILKVNADHPLPAAHWGDSTNVQVGDQVLALGNPFGIGLSVSAGIVSALNRDIQNSPYDDLIQTDATINHGNSGGPLFDMQGNVVGVNSTIISPTSGSAGIGFAIPSASAHFVVDQLLTYGWVRPAWIGVKVQAVTREMADAMGWQRPEGSIVAWVLANGPAKKAGLAIGDVILRYDGITPTDDRALLRDIAHTQIGDTMELTVRRHGAVSTLLLTAAVWPRNQWDALDAPVAVMSPKFSIPPDLGLALSPLPEEDRSKLEAQGLSGVLVTNVAVGSDPARKSMGKGDIILRVQDKSVASPEEVQSAIDTARSQKRDFVLMLVLPKKPTVPGPKWMALQVITAGG